VCEAIEVLEEIVFLRLEFDLAIIELFAIQLWEFNYHP
jgi:hypothetical protein